MFCICPDRGALPAGQLSHGGPPLSQRGPTYTQHNLIYYLRLCFRLDPANEIDSCLIDSIRDVDYLDGLKKKIEIVFGEEIRIYLKIK